jgi:hypothetical protein
MTDPLSSLVRPDDGPVLPSFEAFAPPPPGNLVAAEIAARTSPGDVVIDLHGRGGWIARRAVDRVRRAYTYESTALSRLLAELVLRPPDVRHFDATVSALRAQGHGRAGLKQAIDELYLSTCPGCGRAVVVDEFIWESEAEGPLRKSYRCAVCRDRTGGGEQRSAPTDAEDRERARPTSASRSVDILRNRFPTLADQPDLAGEVLGLYSPRNQVALDALVHGVERDRRAAPIDAALRLALVHTLLPSSRLNGYPGRVAALRIRDGKVKLPSGRQWREHNPWHLFEEGCRLVRAFSQRVSVNGQRSEQARLGDDLLALLDGSANVVVRRSSPVSPAEAPSLPRSRDPGRTDGRARIRLVLTQPPIGWTPENLAFAYLATSIALGHEAATTLPLDRFGALQPPTDGGWDTAALRRSLASVRPVLADDAHVVLLLDRGGTRGVVRGVLDGVSAGYHLAGVSVGDGGDATTGTLDFVPPGGVSPGDPRTHAIGAAPVGPFALADVERAVTDVAIAVLQARGEPASFERLLGEVLVGLDRVGHLRRLEGTRTLAEREARSERSTAAVGLLSEAPPTSHPSRNGSGRAAAAANDATTTIVMDRPASRTPSGAGTAEPIAADAPAAATDVARAAGTVDGDHGDSIQLQGPSAPDASAPGSAIDSDDSEQGDSPRPAGRATSDTNGSVRLPSLGVGARPATDHVGLLLDLVLGELSRPGHPQLTELEPGRWWLRDPEDIATARLPLSDRLEWAVFSLLSTGGDLTESTFYDRVARMFRGHDTPDQDLVRACLESYRDPLVHERLATADDLRARAIEHGRIVALLTEYGHRVGLRVHIGRREQRRRHEGGFLADLLSEQEQRVYLPLIADGEPEALRRSTASGTCAGRSPSCGRSSRRRCSRRRSCGAVGASPRTNVSCGSWSSRPSARSSSGSSSRARPCCDRRSSRTTGTS